MEKFEINNGYHPRAICYSGFRDGQRPGGVCPSYDQIKEDLEILMPHWDLLRLYDCDLHAERVLEVVKNEGFPFKLYLGAYIEAEINNPNCPWGGGVYPDAILEENKVKNEEKIQKLIRLQDEYQDLVWGLSVGNEACVDWTDHLVPVERVMEFAQTIQRASKIPVSFCENYVPWTDHLAGLGEILDFISIHTYPVWEYKSIMDALEYTKQNYSAVAHKFPDKEIVITEAGWTTMSNGRGIHPEHANIYFQKEYIEQLIEWTTEEKIVCFVFEAFDEAWKGSDDVAEPEKHWGLYYSNRKPKPAMSSDIFKSSILQT